MYPFCPDSGYGYRPSHCWTLAQTCSAQVRRNPREVGANRPTTSTGGKWRERRRYSHRSRYRAVHHTVAGWDWPTPPSTQYQWVCWASSSGYRDTGGSSGYDHWSFRGSTSSITGVPRCWGWPHPCRQWPYYTSPGWYGRVNSTHSWDRHSTTCDPNPILGVFLTIHPCLFYMNFSMFSILSTVGYCGWIWWIHPLSEGDGVRVQVWSGYKGDGGSAGVYIPFIYIHLGRTLPYPVLELPL